LTSTLAVQAKAKMPEIPMIGGTMRQARGSEKGSPSAV